MSQRITRAARAGARDPLAGLRAARSRAAGGARADRRARRDRAGGRVGPRPLPPLPASSSWRSTCGRWVIGTRRRCSACSPGSAPTPAPKAEGLLAWAGALVAHDYGVLPSWPHADVAMLMDRAQQAPADVALALGCALGEVCERNGDDAEFAAAGADGGGRDRAGGSAALARLLGHHDGVAPDVVRQARRSSEEARGRAGAGGDARPRRARGQRRPATRSSSRWQRDPAAALALADAAVAPAQPGRGAASGGPDQADIRAGSPCAAADFPCRGRPRAVPPAFCAPLRSGPAVTATASARPYALIGSGAFGWHWPRRAQETPMTRYLAARLACLVDLAVLSAADQGLGGRAGVRLGGWRFLVPFVRGAAAAWWFSGSRPRASRVVVSASAFAVRVRARAAGLGALGLFCGVARGRACGGGRVSSRRAAGAVLAKAESSLNLSNISDIRLVLSRR